MYYTKTINSPQRSSASAPTSVQRPPSIRRQTETLAGIPDDCVQRPADERAVPDATEIQRPCVYCRNAVGAETDAPTLDGSRVLVAAE